MIQLFLGLGLQEIFFVILVLTIKILIIGAILMLFMKLYRRFMKKY